MRVEHWAKDASVDNTFTESEAHKAIEQQFIRSQTWQEHEAFHQKRGEHAVLVIEHEGETMPQENRTEAPEQTDHHAPRRSSLTGYCQCQSPSVRLLLGDDGSVKNEPEPMAETNAYGVEADDSTTYSGSSAATPTYLPNQPAPSSLYKP